MQGWRLHVTSRNPAGSLFVLLAYDTPSSLALVALSQLLASYDSSRQSIRASLAIAYQCVTHRNSLVPYQHLPRSFAVYQPGQGIRRLSVFESNKNATRCNHDTKEMWQCARLDAY